MTKTNHKVAINECYGGFGISYDCARLMAEMGHEKAIEMFNDKAFTGKEDKYGDIEGFYPHLLDTNRHHPILIAAIEKLGSLKASGEYSKIVVYSIKGNEYEITDYDGMETLTTPQSMVGQWRTIKPCGIEWGYRLDTLGKTE